MTWETPAVPVDAGPSTGSLVDSTPLYEDTPWTASGEWTGPGPAPADTGTPGLTSGGGSWWDNFTDKTTSTNVLKAALGIGGLTQFINGRNVAAGQRQIGAMNAALLENEAQFQLAKGRMDEQTLRKKYMALAGKQKAGFGASGVKVNEGSPLMVLEDTYQAMEDDAALIRWNAEIAATKLRNQIPGVQREATLAANKSASAATESLLTAGGRYWQLNG